MTAVPLLLAWSLALGGFGALSLSMPRHAREALGRPVAPAAALRLRLLGWPLLAGSAACCVAAWGWALGTVWWLGVLSAAAAVPPLLLAFAPGRALPGGAALLLLSLLPALALLSLGTTR